MSLRRHSPARTLRGRLTLGLVVVLLAACAVAGVATTLFLRTFLLQRLDAQLASAGGRYSISLEHGQNTAGGNLGGDADADNVGPGQSVGTLGVRILAGKVTNAAVVEPNGTNRIVHLSPTDVATLDAVRVGSDPRIVHLQALSNYRVQATAGRDDDIQITGLPMHDVDQTVGHLIVAEAVLFTVILLLSGVAAALGVRRTLRPLRRIADTALAVSELPLTESRTDLPSRIAPTDPTSEVD